MFYFFVTYLCCFRLTLLQERKKERNKISHLLQKQQWFIYFCLFHLSKYLLCIVCSFILQTIASFMVFIIQLGLSMYFSVLLTQHLYSVNMKNVFCLFSYQFIGWMSSFSMYLTHGFCQVENKLNVKNDRIENFLIFFVTLTKDNDGKSFVRFKMKI